MTCSASVASCSSFATALRRKFSSESRPLENQQLTLSDSFLFVLVEINFFSQHPLCVYIRTYGLARRNFGRADKKPLSSTTFFANSFLSSRIRFRLFSTNSSKLTVKRAMRSFNSSKPKLTWGRVVAIVELECRPGVARGTEETGSKDMAEGV